MLKLKLNLQYFAHLMRITDSLEKTLMLGKIEGGGEGDDRRWDGWMASPTWWTWVWESSRSWWWTEKLGVLQSMGSQRVRHDWATKLRYSQLSTNQVPDTLLNHRNGQSYTKEIDVLLSRVNTYADMCSYQMLIGTMETIIQCNKIEYPWRRGERH